MSACGDIVMGGYSNVFDCVRAEGHDGPHRSFGGSEWNDRNTPDSGSSS